MLDVLAETIVQALSFGVAAVARPSPLVGPLTTTADRWDVGGSAVTISPRRGPVGLRIHHQAAGV